MYYVLSSIRSLNIMWTVKQFSVLSLENWNESMQLNFQHFLLKRSYWEITISFTPITLILCDFLYKEKYSLFSKELHTFSCDYQLFIIVYICKLRVIYRCIYATIVICIPDNDVFYSVHSQSASIQWVCGISWNRRKLSCSTNFFYMHTVIYLLNPVVEIITTVSHATPPTRLNTDIRSPSNAT